MKKLLALLVLAAIAVGAYLTFFGGIEQVTEYRVKAALVEAGVGEKQADCMAGRMTERLSITQLRKLEALGSEDGSKLSLRDYVERVRSIDDPEVIEVSATSAGLCAIGLG
ncbi:hypothetical protein [Altererythrobacter sp. ZODW24]|uniref:hypothetical protein n=1 Tax=Altererythrobacter sp. ZODW24 TaxID=2185142 RepID=UPI001F07CE61|nr:hypothetical protein [Altererythrobacter sp. ZODW24]